MKCPKCQVELHQAGYTFSCSRCRGAWVKDEVLVPLLEERASSLVELAWATSQEHHVRSCPQCGEPMQTVALGTVALDRCPPHGVWFDAGELAAALDEAKQFRAPAKQHESLLHKLGKLLQIDARST
jgi:Zn-finger nucleic acid-binding protein